MNTVIQIRMDKNVKEKAAKILAGMGLNVSSAVQLYFNQIIKEEALPFRPGRNPKDIRAEWDREVKETLKEGKKYSSAEEAHRDILGR